MSAIKLRTADIFSAIAGIPVAGAFYIVGALLSGGGHSVTAITLFFPYGMILGRLLEDTSWEFVAAIALLLQFPFYGFAVSRASDTGRPAFLSIVFGAHVLGVVAASMFMP